MRRHLPLVALLLAVAPAGAMAEEASWIFRPATYSHSPSTGKRIAQYQPEEPAVLHCDPSYQESGYRHEVITIGHGEGADHLNYIQTWGLGVGIRPYGEWEYPFRAGATPLGPWGNPQGPWTLPFDSWQNPYGLQQSYRGNFGSYGGGHPGSFAGASRGGFSAGLGAQPLTGPSAQSQFGGTSASSGPAASGSGAGPVGPSAMPLTTAPTPRGPQSL